MRSISKPIAWLCLLLTLGSAIAFAAHHHSTSAEGAKCTLCIASHSASPQDISTPPSAFFVRLAIFRPKQVSAQQRLLPFALCIRPPPVVQGSNFSCV